MSAVELKGDSQILIVKSKDRSDFKDSDTDFKVDIGPAFQTRDIKRMVIKSAHWINGVYNVPALEDTFVFEHNAAVFSAAITPGIYTTATYIAALKASMDTALGGPTVTITQDLVTQKLTFTFSAGVAKLFAQDDPVNPNAQAKIAGVLTTTAVAAIAITANRGPDLTGGSRVFLRSSALSGQNSVDSAKKTSTIMTAIPIKVAFGFANHFEPNDDELYSINYLTPRNFRFIDIQLVDVDGNVIDNNGYETDFMFKFYF